MAKLWQKLKWLVFLWDTVYMYVVGHTSDADTSSLILDTPPRGSRSVYFVCEKVR